METYCQSSYMHTALDMRFVKLALKTIKKLVKDTKLDFDTIVFRGMSGALLAPLVAQTLKKELLMVRKDDGTHSSYKVEGNLATKRYIILDDLICTGETLKHIFSTLHREGVSQVEGSSRPQFDLRNAECVGIVLYHSGSTVFTYESRFSYIYGGKNYEGQVNTKLFAFRIYGNSNNNGEPYLSEYLGQRLTMY
jgi:hypothetical protein